MVQFMLFLLFTIKSDFTIDKKLKYAFQYLSWNKKFFLHIFILAHLLGQKAS